MKQILPGLLDKYGPNKNVYLQLNQILIDNLVVTNGRLVVNIGFDVDVYVNLGNQDDKVSSLQNCNTCEKTVNFQLQMLSAVYLGNFDETLLKAVILNAIIE